MTQGVGGANPPVGANNTAVAPAGGGPLLSNAKAAERLGVSTKTTGRWRDAGIGPPYVKVGGKNSHVRYPEKDLEDWIRSKRMVSPTTPMKLMPWVVDDDNRILGPAMQDDWGDDVVLLTTIEALTEENWVDSSAMKKAMSAWEEEVIAAREAIRLSIARCEEEAMLAVTGGLGRDDEPGSIL